MGLRAVANLATTIVTGEHIAQNLTTVWYKTFDYQSIRVNPVAKKFTSTRM